MSKQDFLQMDPQELILQATTYNKHLVGHTTYNVEIRLTLDPRKPTQYYLKQLRFSDLEAFDTVLNEKFKNCTFPTLPSKDIFQRSKEEIRLEYI